MAWWHDSTVEDMPAHLAYFRAVDWLDADAPIDPAVDLWESHRWRPRTDDDAVLAAYARFRAARDAWEQSHPEWVAREVAAMVRRRLERARRMYGS